MNFYKIKNNRHPRLPPLSSSAQAFSHSPPSVSAQLTGHFPSLHGFAPPSSFSRTWTLIWSGNLRENLRKGDGKPGLFRFRSGKSRTIAAHIPSRLTRFFLPRKNDRDWPLPIVSGKINVRLARRTVPAPWHTKIISITREIPVKYLIYAGYIGISGWIPILQRLPEIQYIPNRIQRIFCIVPLDSRQNPKFPQNF